MGGLIFQHHVSDANIKTIFNKIIFNFPPWEDGSVPIRGCVRGRSAKSRNSDGLCIKFCRLRRQNFLFVFPNQPVPPVEPGLAAPTLIFIRHKNMSFEYNEDYSSYLS